MRPILIVLFLLGLTSSFSQQQTDIIPRLDLAKIAHINQSDSYITFPTDIGNLESLMFEANINTNFVVRKRVDSRLMIYREKQILNR
ncbi:MAG: hypothetical protein Q8O62_12995 [Aequorivita sp.]|nr:hypothetical protein [Aequorivita sp.]